MMARYHELKTWPTYFEAVSSGSKPFELRKNDRDYGVGDLLLLREWDPSLSVYTGREIRRRVTYVFPGGRFGLDPDYVILGLTPPPNEPIP